MKKTLTTFMGILLAIVSLAQSDTAQVPVKTDTIRIGGMLILKRSDPNSKGVNVTVGHRHYNKKANVNTESFVVDLGFANWVDKTNYATAGSGNYLVSRPGGPALAPTDFRLRTIKSVNVDLWFFMQRVNLIHHVVNLKYGLGLELNNYRFNSSVSFKEAGVNPYNQSLHIDHPFAFNDSIGFSKNKLAADYVTVPLMLNFRTKPDSRDGGLNFSAGVSVGYLYSSRNKQKSSNRGKQINRGDYDLQTWKFAYVGEIGLGPVHLYGSYSPSSIFEKGLNFMPYTVGIRISNW